MKNSLAKTLYHRFVCRWHGMPTHRGGWMLTHAYCQDYKRHAGSYYEIAKVHLKGWSYNDWRVLGINDGNRKSYLSTRDYCSLHPLNGVYSSWIDDKLTLKYILSGTGGGKYMPDYYFQIGGGKNAVTPLMDVCEEYSGKGVYGIMELLREKEVLAFKLIKGSLGAGFYKAEYRGGMFFLNGVRYGEEAFREQVLGLDGYIVTEYLLPHAEFSRFCKDSVGCLRYIIGRRADGSICDIYSFMRIGTAKSNFVENYNAGGVLAIVDDGRYDGGNILDFETCTNRKVSKHPDNGVEIKGVIPHWDEIVKAAHAIADTMPQLSYMGLDFCITHDERIKVIEINSLSSLDAFQLDRPIFDNRGGIFFKERMRRKNQ